MKLCFLVLACVLAIGVSDAQEPENLDLLKDDNSEIEDVLGSQDNDGEIAFEDFFNFDSDSDKIDKSVFEGDILNSKDNIDDNAEESLINDKAEIEGVRKDYEAFEYESEEFPFLPDLEHLEKKSKSEENDPKLDIVKAEESEKPVIDADDKNVFDEIKKFQKALEDDASQETLEDIFEDYQIEDNRSEMKEQVDIPEMLPNNVGQIPADLSKQEELSPSFEIVEENLSASKADEASQVLGQDKAKSNEKKTSLEEYKLYSDEFDYYSDCDGEDTVAKCGIASEEKIDNVKMDPEFVDTKAINSEKEAGVDTTKEQILNSLEDDILLGENINPLANVESNKASDDEQYKNEFKTLDLADAKNRDITQDVDIDAMETDLKKEASVTQNENKSVNKDLDEIIASKSLPKEDDEKKSQELELDVNDDLSTEIIENDSDNAEYVNFDDLFEIPDESKDKSVDTKNGVKLDDDESLSFNPTKNSKEIESIDAKPSNSIKEEQIENAINSAEIKEETTTTHFLRTQDLNPKQYDELMQQFKQAHEIVVDPKSENFNRDVAAIHMQLKVNESTVLTSPNYPRPYPTNNIIDWIFEGEGQGIELNITDFAVNGASGDYLLVKPGGLDESGNEGLIFTYSLSSPRRYRFFDVDRMFIRFESNRGLAAFRGFELSAKMILPLPSADSTEDESEEVVLPEPILKHTILLGGLNIVEFKEQEEQFRLLLADMATMYVNRNGIDRGFNTTAEVTQITNVTLCNINWPDFETCVKLRFAVPLVNEDGPTGRLNEEDLRAMWDTFSTQDPFLARMRSMGLFRYTEPATDQVMGFWLLMGLGFLVAAALLAFALWRFSCIEGYKRMPAYSDTESVQQEKRDLDLYPTPHQSLPALYSDHEYKWDQQFTYPDNSSMGGFTNRTFMRDELLDLDFDQEVDATRDRKA